MKQSYYLTGGITNGNGVIGPASFTTTSLTYFNSPNMKKLTQHKVAVFKVTRNEDNEVTSTEFIKECWIQTELGKSVDFEIARDKELSQYKATDLHIHILYSLSIS